MQGSKKGMALLGQTLRRMFKRERDRRRYANSPYAWLFQPYMGEELVALACESLPGETPVLSVAAVVLNQQQVHTSQHRLVNRLPTLKRLTSRCCASISSFTIPPRRYPSVPR
ncbi:MAG: hypothetical protein ACTH6C_06010, partial [Halomonas sp.]